MTKDEALKLALEALESQHRDRLSYTLAKRSANATCAEFKRNTMSELIESSYMHGMGKQTESAITAIKQVRAAPAQEPVAWISRYGSIHFEPWLDSAPLYTAPPAAQREWVGLTDAEIVFINHHHYNIAFRNFEADLAIARATEAKLRNKNGWSRQHVTDGNPCWCEPETNYTDPETGASVIVHKEPQ